MLSSVSVSNYLIGKNDKVINNKIKYVMGLRLERKMYNDWENTAIGL